MTKSLGKKSIFLFIIMTCFFAALTLLFANSKTNDNLYANETKWTYVYVEAKLAKNQQVPFAESKQWFTSNGFVDIQQNSQNQVVRAKRYTKVGSPFGTLPTVLDGYDQVNWKISGTDIIITSLDNCETLNPVIVLQANYHKYDVVFKNCIGATNNNQNYHTIEKNVEIGPVSKTGYVFLGWTTDYDLTKKQNYTINAEVKDTVTLNANWEPISFTVRFNANGADGYMLNQSFVYDEFQQLDECSFMKNGYNFVGWYKTNESNVEFCDKALVKNLLTTQNAVVDLYAKWTTKNVYYVNFDANGASGNMNKQPLVQNEEVLLYDNAYFKTGYTFVGWNTKSDGRGTTYENKQAVCDLTETPFEVIEFYAIWSENEYVVNFDANGGTGQMNKQTFKYTDIKKLSKNNFSNENLQFACWNTQSDGKGDAYKDGQIVSRLAESGEITLFAIWQPIESSPMSTLTIVIIVIVSVVLIGVVVTTILVKIKMKD